MFAVSVCDVTLFKFADPLVPVGSLIGDVVEAEPINPALVTVVWALADVKPLRFGTVPFGRSGSFSWFAPLAMCYSSID